MQVSNEHVRHAVAHLWTAISTLNSNVVKNMRPARAGVYDEDYPSPLVVSSGFGGRPIYTLNFSMHGWNDLTRENRLEVIYYSEDLRCAEWAVLRVEAAGAKFAFQWLANGRWHECNLLSISIPVSPACVRQALRGLADTVEHDPERVCFDAKILDAVGKLPQPIAEQIAWHLAPPSLEDNLLRRGLASP